MDAQEQLADLQSRFELLQGDRKAFYEQSQLTLKRNKDVVDQLRKEQKELREALSSMSKDKGGAETSAMHEAELVKVEQALTLLRQRQNTVSCGNRAKEKALTILEDELRDLQRSSSRPAHEANPLMRQIRTLENRLDKAMIKYNEAQSIRKTYDQIVKRLKEERVNFDNQLGAIEATLHAKEHDYEELLLMSHDASHAKDVARAELAKLQSLVSEERKARDKELTERRSAVSAREEMATRMMEREKMRQDIVMEAKGDLSTQAEEALKKNLVTNTLHHKLNQNIMEGEQQVMSAYEAAFRKIKEATGVGDVNEVIQKFITQKDTEKNLIAMTREAQARIDQIGEQRAATKASVDEMKYSGAGGQSSRQEVEVAEKKLADATSSCDRIKTRHSRLTKVFVDIRAGVEHMADKLEAVKLDVPSVPVSDDTIVDVMLQCDQKLLKMFSVVGELEEEAPPSPDAASPSRGSTRGVGRGEVQGVGRGEVHPAAEGGAANYNVRVALEEYDDVPGGADDDEEELEGLEPDVLGREAMKKMHGAMLDKATNKGKKGKGKFAGEGSPGSTKGGKAVGQRPPMG
ncbi:neurofilament triplet l [Chrysochromulina tobinii]|uniref:Neurofilament triplet l n=1 Tax=Chrysochromulina tobinii TaxID=1460289 RepID=A0A0M0JLS2_9EUKA|nr:neurofilament triplet l [Chrysochromulina tobinii]|eukprot:KOO27435.1 neurofilament triplet l [Chrysochromulina sp. CCMP291]